MQIIMCWVTGNKKYNVEKYLTINETEPDKQKNKKKFKKKMFRRNGVFLESDSEHIPAKLFSFSPRVSASSCISLLYFLLLVV